MRLSFRFDAAAEHNPEQSRSDDRCHRYRNTEHGARTGLRQETEAIVAVRQQVEADARRERDNAKQERQPRDAGAFRRRRLDHGGVHIGAR
jgi:hypothetical protein